MGVEMNKRFWKRFATVKPYLKYPLYGATIYVLSYNFWLINVSELFNYAYELGKLINGLSLSFISAFIFAFVNVHLTNYADNVKGARYINNKISKIIRLNKELIIAIKNENSAEVKVKINNQTLEQYCSNINPNNEITIRYRSEITFSNWFELFNYIHIEIKEIIQFLSAQPLYKDSELNEILYNLEDQIDNHVNTFKGYKVNVKNSNLDYFISGIIGFNYYCLQLSAHLPKLGSYTEEANETFKKQVKKDTQNQLW